jgi:hypothetical protein
MKKYILSLTLMSLTACGMEQEAKLDIETRDVAIATGKEEGFGSCYAYDDLPNLRIVARHSVSDEQNNARTITILHLNFRNGEIEKTLALSHPLDNREQMKPAEVDIVVQQKLFSRAFALRAEIKAQQHDDEWEEIERARKARRRAKKAVNN